MKELFLIRGCPGSGKSSLAKSIGGVHYEADMFFINPETGVYDMDDIIRMMDKRDIVSDMLFDHHTDEIETEDGKKRK